MDNLFIAAILALVVAGILLPFLRKDLKDSRDTFQAPKPESDFARMLRMMKDKHKNDQHHG